MKKHSLRLTSIILTIALCLGSLFSISFASANVNGDVNGDGILDIVDVVMVRNYIIGSMTFDDAKLKAGDMNNDSTVDIIDVAMMRNVIVNGALVTPPVEDENLTPFEKHGALSVDGANLVDENGEKVQLYGMSTHGIAWFPRYVNLDTFKTLSEDWGTNCVRIAMYTDEYGGYCTSTGKKDQLKNKVKNAVEYATELGMYVIVDWHILTDETPLKYKDEALAFFNEMSQNFADHDNVIYEICNEPNGSTTWDDVKSYANEVIPVIRNNDSNAVVLVGTPKWCQDIHKVSASPLEFDNVMYTLHFYANTHKQWLRTRCESAIKSGLPVFISEFGTCDASGNGSVNYEESNAWKELIEKYGISFMCWNLANNNESSSIIVKSCYKASDWTDDELTEQGKYMKAWFLEKK